MKYLKRFFESLVGSGTKEELQKFCNENLAYLLDEGFEIVVDSYTECYVLVFYSIGADFYFRNIKNDFIPFFEFLKNKYTIIKPLSKYSENSSDIIMFTTVPTSYNKWKSENIFYSESQLLSEKCSNRRMACIKIFIKKSPSN
jgi:hypothetical protein